ncbi:dihydrofolate reductase family protein [Phaeodactylibacter luteus]|nr:dihydrofolate reductase family protein [Phaeodactylibacter luteus]
MVKLFIAATLDGYIARKDGSIDWLEELPNPSGNDHGYNHFYNSIQGLIMGRQTYEDVAAFDMPWPYAGKPTYVFSRSKMAPFSTPDTSQGGSVSRAWLSSLPEKVRSGLWLVGGGELIGAFLQEKLVDEITLCLFPRLLGEGRPLFKGVYPECVLRRKAVEPFDSGLVNITYDII